MHNSQNSEFWKGAFFRQLFLRHRQESDCEVNQQRPRNQQRTRRTFFEVVHQIRSCPIAIPDHLAKNTEEESISKNMEKAHQKQDENEPLDSEEEAIVSFVEKRSLMEYHGYVSDHVCRVSNKTNIKMSQHTIHGNGWTRTWGGRAKREIWRNRIVRRVCDWDRQKLTLQDNGRLEVATIDVYGKLLNSLRQTEMFNGTGTRTLEESAVQRACNGRA